MTSSDRAVSNRAGQLLAGPRGRDVCARVAQLVDPRVELLHSSLDEAATALVVERLRDVDVAPVVSLDDPLALVDALGASVDAARYWQEPEERDVLLQDPSVVEALQPVAQALVRAPATRWWWSPLDPDRQAVVRWLDQRRTRAERPEPEGTAERLERWRSATLADEARAAVERPAAHDASWSGAWWSTPAHANVTTTTRGLGPLPAVQLELVEDSMGWEGARVASLSLARTPRVLEIAEPADWVALVGAYPLDVDRSRRHDWYRTTGGRGPWQVPDWAAVSRDFDAVHLTVAGYLASAGRALACRTGQSVVAGFDPDLTYWLTDDVVRVGAPATWRRAQLDDDHEWRREPGTRRGSGAGWRS